MSIVVVGSVAFDSVKTPYGQVEKALGGSANHFSMSARFFSDVKMVGVIGEDFPDEHLSYLTDQKVCTRGIQKIPGKTFYWKGAYQDDLSEAQTLSTHLNVLAEFNPVLPKDYTQVDALFLANFDPDLQLKVLNQVKNPKIIACDTMNFWIEGKLEALKKVLQRVDLLTINEGEARLLSGEKNLIRAVKKIERMGPHIIIVKRGEYGAMLYNQGRFYVVPAYPLDTLKDPTGAGDSFAGGFMGYLDKSGDPTNEQNLRQAMLYGTVMASYNIQDFSFNRLKEISWNDIDRRYSDLQKVITL